MRRYRKLTWKLTQSYDKINCELLLLLTNISCSPPCLMAGSQKSEDTVTLIQKAEHIYRLKIVHNMLKIILHASKSTHYPCHFSVLFQMCVWKMVSWNILRKERFWSMGILAYEDSKEYTPRRTLWLWSGCCCCCVF